MRYFTVKNIYACFYVSGPSKHTYNLSILGAATAMSKQNIEQGNNPVHRNLRPAVKLEMFCMSTDMPTMARNRQF